MLPPPLPEARPSAQPPAREPRRILAEQAGSGRAEDVPRKTLSELRAGRPRPEREIDLHGLAARAARAQLERELERARRAGARCVLVIHGRGLHSGSGPVLRDALPGWLASEPCASLIQAFALAPAAQGGPGATLVLLRRERDPAVSSGARGGRRDRDPR